MKDYSFLPIITMITLLLSFNDSLHSQSDFLTSEDILSRISSVNCSPNNEEFSIPINAFLEKADSFDIIVIGEQTHYDGTALLLKAELIDSFT